MSMKLSEQRRIAASVYLAYLTIFYGILFFDIEPIATYSNTFGLIGNAMCLPLLWKGIQVHDEESRPPWKLILFGSVSYIIGESLWAYYEDWSGVELDSPSFCDFFYFVDNAACLTALFIFLRRLGVMHMMRASFDMLISVLAFGGIMYNFIVLPLLADGFDGFFTACYLLYNPLFDVALASGILMMIFGNEDHKYLTPTNLFLGVAFAMMFVLDELVLVEQIYGIPFAAQINPLWSMTGMLLGLASMYRAEEPISLNTEKADKIFVYVRILLPYFLTLAIMFLFGLQHNLINSLFLWTMLMVFLLCARQVAVMLRNKRLMDTVRLSEEKLNAQNAELHKLNAKITHDAEIDFLTQLSNRRHIDQTFERMIPVGDRQEELGLILVDVDYFKKVNDTFGHQIGDEVLQKVAALIRAATRHNDIAGRFGGDEFIILMPDADKPSVSRVSERLTELVRSDGSMRKYGVSLSIGGSSLSFTRHDYDIDRLLKRADDALYRAKENGRDQFIVS